MMERPQLEGVQLTIVHSRAPVCIAQTCEASIPIQGPSFIVAHR